MRATEFRRGEEVARELEFLVCASATPVALQMRDNCRCSANPAQELRAALGFLQR
jgi:hypothetical protein